MGWWIYLIVGGFFVASLGYTFTQVKKFRDTPKNYLAQYPDAARVYLTYKEFIAGEAVSVYSVNGELPARFVEGSKSGFYLAPGQGAVKVSYEHARRGILPRSATEGTGKTDMVLEVMPRGKYMLGFDCEANEFVFKPLAQSGS